MVVVEGKDDEIALSALLRHYSKKLATAFSNHTIAIDSLNGASNLAYKAGLLRAAICSVHCALDDDTAGRNAFARAETEGLLSLSDVNFMTCIGRPEAELEDLYDALFYEKLINNKCRVQIDKGFNSNRKKWSDRMRECFKRQGKPWSERLEQQLKAAIAEGVTRDPGAALQSACRSSFDALVGALEARLEEYASGRGA